MSSTRIRQAVRFAADWSPTVLAVAAAIVVTILSPSITAEDAIQWAAGCALVAAGAAIGYAQRDAEAKRQTSRETAPVRVETDA